MTKSQINLKFQNNIVQIFKIWTLDYWCFFVICFLLFEISVPVVNSLANA